MKMGELYQTDNWKNEKHVPVIDCPDSVPSGEFFDVAVTIGKEVAHPNTTAHHIAWVKVYFKPEGGKFPYEIGNFEFSAHGATPEGPDTSTVYTHHKAVCAFKTEKPGTVLATSYCNIHGLWENSKELKLK